MDLKKWGPLISDALGLAAVLPAIAWGVRSIGTSPSVNALIAVAGCLTGWIVGMLIAPSKSEAKYFPEYGKSISTLAGGYLEGG